MCTGQLTDDFEGEVAGGRACGVGRGHRVHAGVRPFRRVYGHGGGPIVVVVVHGHVPIGGGQRLAVGLPPRHRRFRMSPVRDPDLPLVPHPDHLRRFRLVHDDRRHVLHAESARRLYGARAVDRLTRVRARRRLRALADRQLGHVVLERCHRRFVRRPVLEPAHRPRFRLNVSSGIRGSPAEPDLFWSGGGLVSPGRRIMPAVAIVCHP